MGTTLTSIHRANNSNGYNVSFQLDHTIGENHAIFHVFYSSPGHTREVELDVPLTELSELIKSCQQILDESPTRHDWCGTCKGSGEIPEPNAVPSPCPTCGGTGMGL